VWVFFVILAYLICVFFFLRSGPARLYFSISVMIISGVFLFLLLFIQSFSFIDLILFVVLLGLLGFTVFLVFVVKIKSIILKILFVGLNIVLLFIFLLLVRDKWLYVTKLQFLILFLISLPMTKLSFLHYSVKSNDGINLTKRIKYILLLVPLIMALLITLPVRVELIEPKTNPELVFWTSKGALTERSETLELCSENGVAFDIVLRARFMFDDEYVTELFRKLQILVNYDVDFGIAIIGDDDSYCSVENAVKFIDNLRIIRNKFIENGMWKHVKSVDVDAEPPKRIFSDLEYSGMIDKFGYFFDTLATKEEIELMTSKMTEFVELIQEDGKKAGIIKVTTMFDELDNDMDYSLLTKTIYQLDIDWDYSVSMIYRTQHIPTFFDYILEDLGQYDYTSEFQISYYDAEPLQRYLTGTVEYYYQVAFELASEEVNVDSDSRYIFLGSFDLKFSNTSYIQDKEYLEELDICRHFEMDKVYFYMWSSFNQQYGFDGLKELIAHNNQEASWFLVIPSFLFQRQAIFYFLYGIFDRFIII